LSLTSILGCVVLQSLLIFLVLFPTDITGVSVKNKCIPFLGRDLAFGSEWLFPGNRWQLSDGLQYS
jgi:hypothetical protein